MKQVADIEDFPVDFQECVRFHGHVCPGLAIGYAAVKAGARVLGVTSSADEEIVAVVENNSCAVDAVQVLLGCTFGKGNLVFRDWGKQVMTFVDRASGRSVRVSLIGEIPGRARRHELREKMASGRASDADTRLFEQLRFETVKELIEGEPERFFDVREVRLPMPPLSERVGTRPCDRCREPVVTTRLIEREGTLLCAECAADFNEKVSST